jgi:tRNA pseudouridine13 synthase
MKLRRTPADFVVEEVLRDDVLRGAGAWSRSRTFALFRLRKESLSTEEASRRLARSLGVERGAVEHAGLKDKHARTSQHVTAAAPAGRPPARISGERWDAELLGFVPESAQAAWIRRNRFTLVVRGLDDAACAAMDRAAEFLRAGASRLLIVNYFGEQRFGSARHGEGFAAPRLVRGDFEGAVRLLIATPARKDTGARRERTRLLAAHWGRWSAVLPLLGRHPERRAVEALAGGASWREAFGAMPYALRQMAVEAYQSHLWNDAARALSERLAGGESLRAPGELVFPGAARVTGGWRTLELPMVGPGTTLAPGWGAAVEAALARDGLRVNDLVIPGVRRPVFGEAWRPLVVMAEGFRMSGPAADAFTPGRLCREVCFELPRGAYATVVARALAGEVTPSPAGPR